MGFFINRTIFKLYGPFWPKFQAKISALRKRPKLNFSIGIARLEGFKIFLWNCLGFFAPHHPFFFLFLAPFFKVIGCQLKHKILRIISKSSDLVITIEKISLNLEFFSLKTKFLLEKANMERFQQDWSGCTKNSATYFSVLYISLATWISPV